ncbi:MAG: metal-dependent transcriptional regulator, partial [Spirochaetia bacterium]|nr:metal-dependent transcriptional regulator [Spirochaetia bacterium]
HEAIAAFLQNVFLFTEQEAQKMACQIEHVIKPETAKQFRNLTNYLDTSIIDKLITKDNWIKLINTP